MTPGRTLSRRTLLRGMFRGGVISLGVPTLPAMLNGNGTAYAASGAKVAPLFGVCFWGNGVKRDRWIPKSTGAGDAWSLSEELGPLLPVKDYLSVVTGTKINGRNHMAGPAAVLTGAPFVQVGGSFSDPRGVAARPSIDQEVGEAFDTLSPGRRIRSLAVGVCPRILASRGPLLASISHRGYNAHVDPLYDPREVYNQLVGGAFFPPREAQNSGDPRKALWPSVLDLVREDLATLKRKLGPADCGRLAQWTDGIRHVERALDAPALGQACRGLVKPPSIPDTGADREHILAVNRLMADMIAIALACDRTRVFTFKLTSEADQTNFSWLGADRGSHGVTHDDPGDQPVVHKTVTWLQERLAELFVRLRNEPDGAGNLLDRCAIIGTTGVSEGKNHHGVEYPIYVVGRACGRLKGNVHTRSPHSPPTAETKADTRADAYAGADNTLKVHVTVLRALGLSTSGYGVRENFTVPGTSKITLRGGGAAKDFYDQTSYRATESIREIET